jgi:hypothetical protein
MKILQNRIFKSNKKTSNKNYIILKDKVIINNFEHILDIFCQLRLHVTKKMTLDKKDMKNMPC